jgi:AraC family transcriptional regulator, transcriptional activator of pobA
VPVVQYGELASTAITVWRGADGAGRPFSGPHAHDFLSLFYVLSGTVRRRVDDREWELGEGDAFVVSPGAVIGAVGEPGPADSWRVFFPASAVDPAAATPLVSWRGHPLLAPFVGEHRGGAQRLRISDRGPWESTLAALDAELTTREDGYVEAARAHLTLLLVRLGRLGVDGREQVDPLVAQVFAVVEERFAEPISLRDVAAAVGLTPGHLTTTVGRATGRTVQQWITERRMREARRLLVDTDLTVDDVAHRVGYRDPNYFQRRFRAAHGVSPGAWRS